VRRCQESLREVACGATLAGNAAAVINYAIAHSLYGGGIVRFQKLCHRQSGASASATPRFKRLAAANELVHAQDRGRAAPQRLEEVCGTMETPTEIQGELPGAAGQHPSLCNLVADSAYMGSCTWILLFCEFCSGFCCFANTAA
jgi:hypothetical protein